MISAGAVNSTEIFQVAVTSEDPDEAKKISDAVSYILPKRITNIIEGTSAKVVDSAVRPSTPSSPNYAQNTLIGFLDGLAVLLELMNITIHSEEDVGRSCSHPVLAAVPDMESHGKGGYYKGGYYRRGYYGYGKKPKKAYDKTVPGEENKVELMGPKISFAAAEAYKLLRTKLQFSFVDEEGCRVIGVSSSMTGEGKSLSAVNLAYSASQLGKRVLLVDCDMRRPTLQDKLPIRKTPGLSEFLTGQSFADNLIQMCGIKEDEYAFHAISSGHNPPNPMELLSSARMERMLSRLRQNYDYIILDLPPVGEVGDALAVSKLTDGILVVVRQNLCDRLALNAAIRQFEFVDAKILGVIFNCTTEDGSKYGKRYYKNYQSYDTDAKKDSGFFTAAQKKTGNTAVKKDRKR